MITRNFYKLNGLMRHGSVYPSSVADAVRSVF